MAQDELDPNTRLLIEQYGRPFVQGDILFREGEPATHAYLVHEGRVRLLKRVHAAPRSVAVARPGDIFGEEALLDGSVHPSTAVALSDGIFFAIDRRALRVVLERFPQLGERIVEQLVRRLRDAEDQVDVLMLRDSGSKIVSALLKMVQGRPGPVELSMSPVDLAGRVGLDVETVKRMVQRLRDQQYLRIVGERIEVPDVDALRRLYALLGTKDELRGERGST